MRRKLLITIIIIFGPIAFLEHPSSNSSVKCQNKNNIGLFLPETSGYKTINSLLDCTKNSSVLVNDCWEDGDLASQMRYCLTDKSPI